MRGVSEQVKRVLCNAGVQTAYKPMQSLGDIFGKPKDRQADSEIKGIVYNGLNAQNVYSLILVRAKDRGSHGGLSTSQAYDQK